MAPVVTLLAVAMMEVHEDKPHLQMLMRIAVSIEEVEEEHVAF